jgi:hypothetical protein
MIQRPTKAVQAAIALPEAIDLIRFEKNLLQIGFFSAHDRRSAAQDLSRRIEQWVNRDGKKIRVSAEFRSTLGLPSTADRDKYMAFMKIAMERKLIEGKISNPIRFSGYSMLKTLGLSDAGANYEDLNQWGMRMADTTITSEQIIYSSSRRKFMNKTVHVFKSFTREGESNLSGSNQSVQFAIELEDWLLENLNQSYVVPEDFTQYRKLVRPTAKGIFVYLYVWFYASQGKEVEKDYGELCALLNVTCYSHASKIKETMGLSLDDLVQIGYLKTWDIRRMSSKKGYKLVLSPGRAIMEVIESTQRRQIAAYPKAQKVLSAPQQGLVTALMIHGVDEEKAKSLCSNHDLQLLESQLEYLTCEISRDNGRRIKNPAGFVVSFIEGKKSVPPSFETTLMRRAREQQEEESRRREAEKSAAEVRELQFRSRYEAWREMQISDAFSHMYSLEEIDQKLGRLRTEKSKDLRFKVFIERLTQVQRREELLRHLRKEVSDELDLPSYESWCEVNGQGELFVD